MSQPKEGRSLKLQLKFSSIEIVIYTSGLLLLTQNSSGQYEVVSSPQQIFTITDDDVILPCQLKPPLDAVSMAVEWTRPDLYPRFVHVRRGGQDLLVDQNLKYEGRTMMSIKKLRLGDVSLKLSKVELSDAGAYKCFIPGINKNAVVHLVVGAVSFPVIVSIDRGTSGLVLQCESKGWYPEPEVLWLDSAGNHLSAGPTETLKGPDGLFTVSSKLIVTKTQSNSFTCRVHQKIMNQTRETGIHVQDVSMTWSDSVCIIVVLSVALLLSLAVLFVLWKRKRRGHDKMHQEREKLEEKEEEKNDMQHVILILEEEKKELESTRTELILKLKEVEEEWMENEKKIKKLNKGFNWNKDTEESSLLKLKIELENEKGEYKKYLESIETVLKKNMDVISKIENRKKKVENHIDEIKKSLNRSNTQQVEVERGENKTNPQRVEHVKQQTKNNEMNPLLETKIELENEKKESKKPSDSNEKKEQESIEKISVLQEQETDPKRTGAEQKLKKKEEKGEKKNKLQKVKDHFHRNKHDETKPESKIELENEKTESKKPSDSNDKNEQESVEKISVLEEPENSREEQRPKQKKVEKEKGEKKKKLQNLTHRFHRNKRDETKPESKIELGNKKTEHKSLLDSIEKNLQESMDMISILEEQKEKTEPENSRAEQRPKQKEEKEKGEKNKLQKVKDRFNRNKHDETKPESKIELENKKTERENLLDLEKNVHSGDTIAN